MVHANALLTPRGRLALARCIVEDGWSLRRAAERFQTSHNTARRWAARYRAAGPVPAGDRGDGRPLEPAAPQPAADPGEGRAADLSPAPDPRLGTGPDRHRLGHASLDGEPGAAPGRDGAAGAPGPGHPPPAARPGASATSTRTRGRWCTWTSRSSGRSPTGGGHRAHGRALGRRNSRLSHHDPQGQPPGDRLRLRPQRAGRPLPAGLQRGPARRAGRHRRRVLDPGDRLVRRPRRHHRAGADRQRLLLPVPALGRGLRRPRHPRTSGPGPTGPRPTARSNGSTAPCSPSGPTSGSTPPKPPEPGP